ncbi:MAG: nucleotide sugar dehydrogenase, partial [Anaerolineae bacterium]|nr:nucleotide sugar dehydrogenase [Anaerolineae bacterium]
MSLSTKISDKTATIGIVGLGYVGLPHAVAFATAGFPVIGIDVNGERVAAINRGVSQIPDVPSEQLAPLVATHGMSASTDPGHL